MAPNPSSLLLPTPFILKDPIWIRSTFTFHRNLGAYLFPGALEGSKFPKLFAELSSQLVKLKELNTAAAFEAIALSPLERELISEHFLLLEGSSDLLPGQGFVLDTEGKFLAIVNKEDHLQLHMIDPQGEWETPFQRLDQIETVLGNTLPFAFNPTFGYLTADKTHAGTGLVCHLYLHLPALIHTQRLDKIIKEEPQNGVCFFSLCGPLDLLVGDLIVLRNTYTLGCNEESVLSTLHASAMRLISLEKEARSLLKKENPADLKEKISRSYGLCIHSYQLQAKEALDALSLMKLGVDLGWIEGASDALLTELLFKSQRAHLLYAMNIPETKTEEIPHKRAEFLHTHLKELVLKL